VTSEPQAVSGSLLWQVVFLSFAVVLILFVGGDWVCFVN